MGWALPESHWSHVYTSNTCATLSPLRLCSPAAPLSLSAPLSCPLSVTFSSWCCTDNKASPKPYIYITIGVPMPRNSHDAQKRVKNGRSNKIFTEDRILWRYNTNVFLFREVSDVNFAHIWENIRKFTCHVGCFSPWGATWNQPPPRFCPFMKLFSKSKLNGAKSPKKKNA